MHKRVNEFAHVLDQHGIKKGDRVCLYMGMIPELAIAVLSCARIGAIHSVIFGGFSAQSISDRVNDAQANCIITCDAAYRGPKTIPLKSVIDDALESCTSVKKVFVYNRVNESVNMEADRDFWWDQEIEKVHNLGLHDFPAIAMDAEDPLFILYTSGSTGKPKGVSILAPDIWYGRIIPLLMYSNTRKIKYTFALRISVGSRTLLHRLMAHYLLVQQP